MGTWSVPWKTLAQAEEFRDRMAKPWIATVEPPNDEHDWWDWTAEGLYGLFGSDSLFDDLGAAADALKAPFDVRDKVHSHLHEIVADLDVEGWVEPEQMPALNVVRETLGLKPL